MLVRHVLKEFNDLVSQNIELDGNSPRLILEEVLNVFGASFYLALGDEISLEAYDKAKEYLNRYLLGEPLQYIFGHTYFYGLKINVDPRVLIPRYETEELVNLILKENGREKITVVDLGVGSGCISLSLKKQAPLWKVYGVDISSQAIEVCMQNAIENDVQIKVFEGDLLKPLIDKGIKVNVIVSNPPYIDYEDKEVGDSVRRFEPAIALFADHHGLLAYEKIYADASKVLLPKGIIYLEIGYTQMEPLKELIEKQFHKCEYRFINDINGKNRFLKIWNISF